MGWRGALIGGVASVALLGPGWAWAQSLEEALVSAYANNPTLQAQRAKVRSTDEGVPQALANWRPKISVDGSVASQAYYNYAATAGTTAYGQHRDPKSVGASLTQSLFRGFRTLNETDRAELKVLAERARLASTEQDILSKAATSYLDVVREQATLELNRGNEQVLRRQLEAARDRFRVGEITRTDVHQAEARVAKAQADRIQAENNLEASRATYANYVGEAAGKLARPGMPTDLPVSKDEALKVATVAYPLVQAAELDSAASDKYVDVVRGELMPSLDLSAKASKDYDSSAEDNRINTLEGKLTLTVPLYEKGSVYSRLREAKQLAAQDRHKTDKERRDAREKAVRAWEQLESARARVDSYGAQIRASEIALEGVEKEAAVGSRTVLDVLDAEQEVLDAKVNLVKAQRDELVAIFDLKAAMGQLTAEKLNLRAAIYNPLAHYNEVRDKWFGGSSSGDISDKPVK
ncbi:MAG: TolC family outer membrane protein [Magnetospirillum sp. WYHS-4]